MSRRLLIATGAVAVNPADLPFGVRLLIDAAESIFVTAPRLVARNVDAEVLQRQRRSCRSRR